MELIDNFAAVRLLINVYMVKKVKSPYTSVNQEKFIEEVISAYKRRHLNYPIKTILFTWKHLLDKYQYYKQNFSSERAEKEWEYFVLMDNCFDGSKRVNDKFNDPKWSLALIKALENHRSTVLKQGLTIDVLQAVEDEFQRMGNYDITQKDIYKQWLALKSFYRKHCKTENPELGENDLFYNALRDFFKNDELAAAIESIKPTNETTGKRQFDNKNDSVDDSLLEALKNNKKVRRKDVVISEKLLNVYECNNREFLDIKDTLIERNLLREETNYLLNAFMQKLNGKKAK